MSVPTAVNDSLRVLEGYPLTFIVTLLFYFMVKILMMIKPKEEKSQTH